MTYQQVLSLFIEQGEDAVKLLAEVQRWTKETTRSLRKQIAGSFSGSGEKASQARRLVVVLTSLMAS